MQRRTVLSRNHGGADESRAINEEAEAADGSDGIGLRNHVQVVPHVTG